MKYVPPVGASANAPYVNANPVAGIQGSPVPAEAIEHPQREITAAITSAGLTPNALDLTQLSKAIQTLGAGLPATKTRLGSVKIGDGVSVKADGTISIDFNEMPTDKFEEILKQLRVPVWLVKNTTWYVRSNGSDSNDGLSEAKAFKTLQKAINNVASNYNLDKYNATIDIGAGEYPTAIIPKYNATTGVIILQGAGIGQTKIKHENGYAINSVVNAGAYEFYDMTVQTDVTVTTGGGFSCCVANAGAQLTFQRCHFIYNETAVNTAATLALIRADKGTVNISNMSMAVNGRTGGNSRIAVMLALNGGNISITHEDVKIDGHCRICLILSSLSIFGRGIALPLFTGALTGKRYEVAGNSICGTRSGGASFFPGDSAGSTATGGQYS